MAARVEVCGPLSVVIDGEPREGALRGRQGRMLLAYLVLNRHRAVRRDELADVLWAESGTPEGGEALLAPPLSRLRRALGDGRLVGRGELRLALGEDAEVDWEVAHEALGHARSLLAGGDASGALEAAGTAERIAAGGLLPELEAPWIDVRRAELGDLRLEALELRAAAGMRLGAGALPDAERAARTAVELAPFRESARAALMEVLAARGNVAEALRAFEDARVLLREELGSSPGPALVALHERLVREEPVAPVAPVAAPSGLVERDAEVALLGRLAAEAAAGEGRTALIEGPAGLGKTRLLGELRKLAEAGGARVLSARASDLERDYPFGVVRQLLEGVVLDPASAERALAGAAAPARAVFEFAGGDQSGAFAALHGLYWVCVNLAGERPLAVVVDDIHWADSPSLRFLAYLARRLEGLPVLLAATLRTGEPGTDLALMAEIAEDAATTSVRPGPLSAAAVAEVARMRLGPGADDAFCAACHVTTGGNPLLLRQLLTALEAEGVEPDEAHADVVRAIGSRAIAASVVRRLSRLPAGAGALGRAVAVLGDGAELAPAAALAALAEPDAASAAALLSRAEILRAEAPLAFVHPLVRDAVYRDIPPGERELAHERAARVLRDASAPVDQIAGHLLLAPRRGEPWVAEALLQTGGDALRRGAPDPAVAHLRRALAEPPPAEARPGVLLELGLAELVSSEPLRPDTLEEAYATVTDPGARLVAAHALARTHLFAGHPTEGVAVVERAIADLPPGAEDERLGLEAVRLCAVWFGAGDPASLDELLPWRERELTTLGEKMMGAGAALEAAYRGAPADVVAGCSLRALAGGDVIAADNGLLSNSAIPPLAMVDREEVMDAWHDALADAHRAGSPYSISGIHIWRGYTHILRGELLDACADLEEAVDECRRFDYSANVVVYAASFLARALTERGLLGRARETLALVPQGEIAENVEGLRFFRNARLELLVASGQWDAVPAAAEEARRRIDVWDNPLGHRWRSLSALALAQNGARGEAESLISAELDHARRIGAPGTVGRSLRALSSVSGDLSPLREAVTLLEGSPARLELAKALCDLGSAEDDAGMLRRALNLALGAGAEPVAARAGAALAALGAAPAPPDDDVLTWAERRALTLARDGAGEREIAEALFLAPFEVARHLASARAKLGST